MTVKVIRKYTVWARSNNEAISGTTEVVEVASLIMNFIEAKIGIIGADSRRRNAEKFGNEVSTGSEIFRTVGCVRK